MADKAHRLTDEKLEEMEKRLSAIYSRAEKEIGERWKEYLAEAQAEIDELQKAYDLAKEGGDPKEIRKAGRKLSKAKRDCTLMNNRFKDLTERTAAELSNVNKTALAYINGQLPEVYSINYNVLAPTVDGVVVTMGGVDVTGTVYHAATGEIRIEEVTGDIVITAKAKAPYTNVIDTVGTVDNVRLRSSGATTWAAGFASNYFPAKGGDIIRVYFPNGNRASIPSNGVYCCTYSDTSGTLVTAYDGSSSSSVLKNVTDKGYEIHIPTSVNCYYARVAGGPNGAYDGWIVTVNETIPQAPKLD